MKINSQEVVANALALVNAKREGEATMEAVGLIERIAANQETIRAAEEDNVICRKQLARLTVDEVQPEVLGL